VTDTVVDGNAGGDSNTLLNILAFEFLGDGTATSKNFWGEEVRKSV
jgi:hypothetical protein